LLEADVVYVRDPLELGSWSDEQLRKLAVLAHECFSSPDLTIHLLAELDRRYSTDTSQPTLKAEYLKLLNTAKP
jgi:hypothetical protein